MSEEEIKAIENLKHIVKHWKPNDEEDELANIEYNSIRIAVNLIEKQQKEIETLSIQNAMMSERHFRDSEKLRNSVSKDKIEEYLKHEIWLCEHDIDACCDDELDLKKRFIRRKKIFEEIQDKLLEV